MGRLLPFMTGSNCDHKPSSQKELRHKQPSVCLSVTHIKAQGCRSYRLKDSDIAARNHWPTAQA